MLRGRILVADDDPDLLRSVADALEQAGATVVRAEDGAELIQKMANEGPFAVIVTDIAMPWMSGLQATHSARYAGLVTPVVVMTALRDASIPDQVRALGHDVALLRKPFGLAELESTIERIVATKLPN
jgi:CheY-like chemotaxis protein